MVDSAYFVFRAFNATFQHFIDMLQTLKICMKKFDGEKMFFDKLTGFLT